MTYSEGKDVDITTVSVETSKFVSTPIARMPSGGLEGRDTYSTAFMEWLNYESSVRGVYIQHALTAEGEFKVPCVTSERDITGLMDTVLRITPFLNSMDAFIMDVRSASLTMGIQDGVMTVYQNLILFTLTHIRQ